MKQPVGLHEIEDDLAPDDLAAAMAVLLVIEAEAYLASVAEFEARYPEN